MLQSENMNYPGKLVLIVGAAGSGKGVLIRSAKALHPEIIFAISSTTRAMRPSESDGHPYHFITKEEFETLVEAGGFIEWVSTDGKLYGTQKEEVLPGLEKGAVVLKEMEPRGISQIREILPKENIVTIYIDAGSWDTLVKRITSRAPISEEELESRRIRYEYERTFKDEADYVVENFDGKFAEADMAFDEIITSLLSSA
jgi:guanylate kinase